MEKFLNKTPSVAASFLTLADILELKPNIWALFTAAVSMSELITGPTLLEIRLIFPLILFNTASRPP